MGECHMKKEIYFPIIAMIIGEILIFYDNILVGLGIHVINVFAIILMITFGNFEVDNKTIMQSLVIFPLLRTINITTPQLFADILVQKILISGIMFIPFYYIVKSQQISFKKLEKDFDRTYVYIFMVMLIWTIMMTIKQYYIPIYNVQTFNPAIVKAGGIFTGIFLMISLPISLIIADTKYYNKFVSNTFRMCNNSLLMVFITIVINGVISILRI